MAKEGTYRYKIEKIKTSLDNNKANLATVISNYKTQVDSINTTINNITFDSWKDSVADEYSSYIEFLKQGIVSKLNSSINTKGSIATLEQLLTDLETKCNEYLNIIDSATKDSTNMISYIESTNSFADSPIVYGSEEVKENRTTNITELNTQFSNLTTSIDDILEKIKSLEFDMSLDYQPSNDYDFSMLSYFVFFWV